MRFARVAVGENGYYAVFDPTENIWRLLACAPYEGITYVGKTIAADAAKLLAPCVPSKVMCVGLNYRDHIEEMKHEDVPEDPVIFMKPATAVIGPAEEIVRPEKAQRVDYEGELAVVIGKKMRNVAAGDALSYVFGYTCLNDVTERILQKKDGQWTRGKGFDTFCPIGPWIETSVDPSALDIESRLNGSVGQKSNTSLLITNVPKLLAFISSFTTLLPGDVVATGTPAGVGPMVSGDNIEIEIAGIGVLPNPVK